MDLYKQKQREHDIHPRWLFHDPASGSWVIGISHPVTHDHHVRAVDPRRCRMVDLELGPPIKSTLETNDNKIKHVFEWKA